MNAGRRTTFGQRRINDIAAGFFPRHMGNWLRHGNARGCAGESNEFVESVTRWFSGWRAKDPPTMTQTACDVAVNVTILKYDSDLTKAAQQQDVCVLVGCNPDCVSRLVWLMWTTGKSRRNLDGVLRRQQWKCDNADDKSFTMSVLFSSSSQFRVTFLNSNFVIALAVIFQVR